MMLEWTHKHVEYSRKAKHLDVTTMFTYPHVNTPLGQSERARTILAIL